MTRATLILVNDKVREKAAGWCEKLPAGTRVTFNKPKRSLPQSARMWACLTDFATQVSWHGMSLSPNDWKLLFLDALKREMRIVPNLDSTGFVNLGASSSDLSKEEMSLLLELIEAVGANHGVTFMDQDKGAAA